MSGTQCARLRAAALVGSLIAGVDATLATPAEADGLPVTRSAAAHLVLAGFDAEATRLVHTAAPAARPSRGSVS